MKRSQPQVCLVSFGCWSTALAAELCQNKSWLLLALCAHTHTHTLKRTHFTCFGKTVSVASNPHLPIALRSSFLLNTGALRCWAEFSLQPILQCKEKVSTQPANRHYWHQIAKKKKTGGEKKKCPFSLNSGSAKGYFKTSKTIKSCIPPGAPANCLWVQTAALDAAARCVHVFKPNHKDKQPRMWLQTEPNPAGRSGVCAAVCHLLL